MEILIGIASAALLLGTIVAVETVGPVHNYSLTSKLPGFALSIVSLLLGAALLYTLQALWAGLGMPALVNVPLAGMIGDAAAIAVVIVVADFLAYWHHRAQHRFFWPIHAVHHSATELHAANSFGHFLEKASAFLFITLPLSLIDFNVSTAPYAVVALRQMLEYYIHSPVTAHFGPARALLVDNRFHRIHHSLEERHFDKNFGIMFSIWDRLFGTAHEPLPDEWPETGVDGHPSPRSFRDYLFFPLRWVTSSGISASSSSSS